MKTNLRLFKLAIFFICLWTVASSFENVKSDYLNPRIQMGKAKISGRITCADKSQFDKPVLMTFSIAHPITGEVIKKEVKTDELGNYSIELDTETNPVIIGLFTDMNRSKAIVLELSSDKESQVDILYTDDGNLKILKLPESELTYNDMVHGADILGNILDYHSGGKTPSLYDKTPEFFLKYADDCISMRVGLVDNDSLISEKQKKYWGNDVRLVYYCLDCKCLCTPIEYVYEAFIEKADRKHT